MQCHSDKERTQWLDAFQQEREQAHLDQYDRLTGLSQHYSQSSKCWMQRNSKFPKVLVVEAFLVHDPEFA
ncbi:MAG: hypothetical protein AAF483_29775, partial [Planctomycetota bacterium]